MESPSPRPGQKHARCSYQHPCRAPRTCDLRYGLRKAMGGDGGNSAYSIGREACMEHRTVASANMFACVPIVPSGMETRGNKFKRESNAATHRWQAKTVRPMPTYDTLVSHRRDLYAKTPNWSDRSRQVLFGCEHQHRETERRGNEHFDKHALGEIDIRCGKRTIRQAI